jgi:hypothetical protein
MRGAHHASHGANGRNASAACRFHGSDEYLHASFDEVQVGVLHGFCENAHLQNNWSVLSKIAL